MEITVFDSKERAGRNKTVTMEDIEVVTPSLPANTCVRRSDFARCDDELLVI